MYRRVLLKLSGEALSGEGNKGFSEERLQYLVNELRGVKERGIEIAIVIGAGNLFRGKELTHISPTVSDEIGMLGTLINTLYLKDYLSSKGLKAVAISSIVSFPSFEPYKYSRAEQLLREGNIVILGGGTTIPYFTTDTAAAIRAIELHTDIIIKATKVDGVYELDPKKHPDTKKIDRITFTEAIELDLKIMDIEAFSICKKHKLPIIVIDFFTSGNLLRAIIGEKVGTLVIPD